MDNVYGVNEAYSKKLHALHKCMYQSTTIASPPLKKRRRRRVNVLACTAVTPGKNGLTRQSAIDLAANQRPAASVPWALQCHHKQSTTPRQVCWGSTGHVSLLCMRSACPDALCFHTAWAISVLLRSQVLSQQSSACSLPRRSEGTDVCYMKDLPYVFTAAGTLSC